LTVYYGSFLNLIKAASKWQDKVVVDVQKYYRGKDVFKLVNTSKLVSPLIVIDPVQKDRNAAAALSAEKFELFKKAAQNFLKNPSNGFFIKKSLDEIFLKEKSTDKKLIKISVKPLAGKIDVVGSKMLKIYEFSANELNRHNFKTLKAGWEWDKKNDAIFYFLFEKKKLPKTIEIEGPPLKIEQHASNFRKMHKKTFTKNGKIYAKEQRMFTSPEYLLKNSIKNQFVKERSKSIKIEIL
jgi:tRNA nucleotidyltransferase (CCA-adding enzyme)